MAQETTYRLERLETVLAEFIMQTNRSLTRMERDTEEFKQLMQQRDEEYRDAQQRLDAEYKAADQRRAEEQQTRDAEYKAVELRLTEQQQTRDAEYKAVELRLTEQQQARDAEYKADEKRRAEEWEKEKKQMNREWNQKWGEVTEKMGTFAEDLAAPNLRRIAREQFGYQTFTFFAPRVDKTNPLDPSQVFEFDAILVTEQTVFLLEAKFSVRMTYLERMPKLIENFKLCFPEYASHKIIPVFASMSIREDQVNYLTGLGVYAMALGEETMELLNFNELQSRF